MEMPQKDKELRDRLEATTGNSPEAEQLRREIANPRLAFRGQIINLLRDGALRILAPFQSQLSGIPLGPIPTRQLNACAVRTPRGGAVILLDHGVLLHVSMLVRSYLAFYTWHSETPYCRDHSQDEFAETILLLAESCATGRQLPLKRISTWNCPSLGDFDPTTETLASQIELLILLHEFGHVVLKHLHADHTAELRLHDQKSVPMYTKSQNQEFEADQFAFEQMKSVGTGHVLPTDVAFSFGLLLKFFGLCESLSPARGPASQHTHPPASSRWDRVKSIAGVASQQETLAFRLDGAFDVLFKGAGLTPG